MKIIVFLVLFVTIIAFSSNSQYEWTDENGCSYCLYGYYKDGKCVHENRKNYFRHDLEIRKLSNDCFFVDYDFRSMLHVYCENIGSYCKTINNSMVAKLMPSLKERKYFCKKQSEKKQNTGLFYTIPIHSDYLKFLCDFVEFDYRKSFFRTLGQGTCPVREKGPTTPTGRAVYVFYNLYITKGKMIDVKKEKVFSQTHDKKYIIKNDFVSIGDCSNSNCEILNYIGGKPQDFDIKCDFITKDGNEGKVKVLAAGVCPIEVLDKDGKKHVYRVRSVKDGDGYKLLMTNKRK